MLKASNISTVIIDLFHTPVSSYLTEIIKDDTQIFVFLLSKNKQIQPLKSINWRSKGTTFRVILVYLREINGISFRCLKSQRVAILAC